MATTTQPGSTASSTSASGRSPTPPRAASAPREWPADHPVPQATIEFEVPDVEEAVAELLAAGYTLLHGTRLEEWGQTTARLQSPEGLIVGAVVTPEPQA